MNIQRRKIISGALAGPLLGCGAISMIIRSAVQVPNNGNKQESDTVHHEVLERAVGLVALFETLYLL